MSNAKKLKTLEATCDVSAKKGRGCVAHSVYFLRAATKSKETFRSNLARALRVATFRVHSCAAWPRLKPWWAAVVWKLIEARRSINDLPDKMFVLVIVFSWWVGGIGKNFTALLSTRKKSHESFCGSVILKRAYAALLRFRVDFNLSWLRHLSFSCRNQSSRDRLCQFQTASK